MSLSFVTDFMDVWPLWGCYNIELETFYFRGENELLSITGKDGLFQNVIDFMALTGWKRVGLSPRFVVYANPPTAFLIETGALSLEALD